MEFMVRHLEAQVASRIQIAHFPAGHPIYFGAISHEKFTSDMKTFLAR
jgi:hypothetical protein